jgi:hypothetical protein
MQRIALRLRHTGLLVFAILLALSSVSASASAAELAMYRRAGCPWCLRWDREIGGVYAKTAVGRQLPLRMIDLDGERPKLVLKSPVIYTPTFVLVENGREIGRIEGYAGDDFFWGLLERLAGQAQPPAPPTRPAT